MRAENATDGSRRWLCKCDCGNEKVVFAYNLHSGDVKSCGCAQYRGLRPPKRVILQTGDRFGRLVVKNFAGVRQVSPKSTRRVYLCSCDCGNEVEIPGSQLRSGGTFSCGCLREESRKRSSETRWRKVRGNVPLTPRNKAERDKFGRLTHLIRQRDNFTCVLCDHSRSKLPVHHIKPWSKYPKLRFEQANLATLCEKCHIDAHDGNAGKVAGRVNARIAKILSARVALKPRIVFPSETPVATISKKGAV